MAKQISLITFTGKLGNLIGYERGGKYFLRSMPEIVRQTTATRRAAQRFGIASRKAALIRSAFYDELDIHCDSSHVNRLNRILIGAQEIIRRLWASVLISMQEQIASLRFPPGCSEMVQYIFPRNTSPNTKTLLHCKSK